jgi:phosphatidate cytidylyltransferase
MLITRIATAAILLAVCITALLYLPSPWWTALIMPVLALGAWEWSALAGLRKTARWAYVALLFFSGLAVLGAASLFPGGGEMIPPALYGAAALFWLGVVPGILARRWQARTGAVLAIIGWLVLVPAWLALAQLQVDAAKLLALLGVIWVSDTAAYLSGRAWGRHKLAPSISPGKTWEGVAGAGVAVAVYYVALSFAAPAWGWWHGAGGAILFAGTAAMGIVGDLFESWMKRRAAVKDSGTLLPGHGGVLDRIDSLTAALPVAALLLPYAG